MHLRKKKKNFPLSWKISPPFDSNVTFCKLLNCLSQCCFSSIPFQGKWINQVKSLDNCLVQCLAQSKCSINCHHFKSETIYTSSNLSFYYFLRFVKELPSWHISTISKGNSALFSFHRLPYILIVKSHNLAIKCHTVCFDSYCFFRANHSVRALHKIGNASQICVSSLLRGHDHFLCIVPT